MAKVTITIEDIEDGKCAITADPPWTALRDKHVSGHELTPAEGYALRAFRFVHEASREEGRKNMNDALNAQVERLKAIQ